MQGFFYIKLYQNVTKCFRNVARLTGIEPVTYGLEGRCSILLSYRRMFGSASRARTYDPVINSHLLYLLSYRGVVLYVYFVDCAKDIFETIHKETASDDMRISSPLLTINIDINLLIDFEFFFSSHSLVPSI